jgi:uncharacterized protein (DUF486 family)/diadenosine tetraphosphate (Ap4A) HIT family hydrolase
MGAFSIPTVVKTIVLLTLSNVFMTFAWYAHLKNLGSKPWVIAAFVSWGIALFEYLLQVPANRIGYTELSIGQLKILQEVIARGVCAFRLVLHAPAAQTRLSLGRAVHDRGRVFHVPVAAMTTAIHRQVLELQQGREPRFIARLASGWAVLGTRQFLAGYSLLLPDPVVPHLNALEETARRQFLADMARLGDALLKATGAIRINYAMLGNLEPALHAHLFPRYAEEPEALRTAHPWAYDWQAARAFDAGQDSALVERIRRALD